MKSDCDNDIYLLGQFQLEMFVTREMTHVGVKNFEQISFVTD